MTGTGDRVAVVRPATVSQQGLVLGSMVARDDGLFIEQATIPLRGRLDIERLRAAWRSLVASTEVLRTGFATNVSDVPRQVVLKASAIGRAAAIPLLDASVSLADVLADQRSSFAFNDPPLVRLAIQPGPGDTHVLIWTHHHAVLDGWSQMLLLDDLLRTHDGVPRLSRPSFDAYATWLGRRPTDAARRFWTVALDGLVAPPPLSRRTVEGKRYDASEAVVPASSRVAIESIARAAEITPAAVILSAWALVAARLRSSDEVVLGVSVSGRLPDFEGVDRVVGPLVTTIPQRIAVDRSASFDQWAVTVQTSLAEASAYASGASAEIHSWAHQPANRPLYDSVVAVANYPSIGAGRGVAVDLARINAWGGRTMLPLALVVTSFDGLRLRLVNDRSRVDDDATARAVAATAAVLDAVVRHSGKLDVGAFDEVLTGVAPLHDSASDRPQRRPIQDADEVDGIDDTVVRLFAAALNVNVDTVGHDADLLSLGGHSMLAVGLLADIRNAFAVDLTLRALFDAPTPRGVAAIVRSLLRGAARIAEEMPKIVPSSRADGDPFPLTEIQAAYWVGRDPAFELSEVDSHLYGEIDIEELDVDLLEHAWNRLVRRHPMLRAVITADGHQVVIPEVPRYVIARTDATGGCTDEVLGAARARLSHAHRVPSVWPLFTIEVAAVSARVTRVFLSFDLLIGDARSWRILYQELRSLYDNPEVELSPLELTFHDYVAALPAIEATATFARARDYWRSRLDDLPAAPAFPLARRPRELDRVDFIRRTLTLTAVETRSLRSLAARLGVTLSTLLLAAFGEVLGRHTNAARLLINVTLYQRLPLHPQVDEVVGDFTSLLLATVDLTDDDFATRTRRLQRQLWTDLDHRLYSGLRVLRDLVASQSGDLTSATAPVVFTSTLDIDQGGHHHDGGLPGTLVYAIGQTPQVALDYQTYELDGRLVVNWDTVEALFFDGYVDDAFDAHAGLLRRLAADPATVDEPVALPIARIAPTGTSGEPLGGDRLLHEPFVEQARRVPDATAVIDDDVILSYGETLARSEAVARAILELDAGDGLVAVRLHNGWEQVVAVLASLLAGHPFVPIDADWPDERMRRVLKRTGAKVVLTHSGIVQSIPDGVRSVAVDRVPTNDAAPREATSRQVDDLAYVIFTSGSTGEPKGVMIRHRAALNTVLDVNTRFGVGPADRILRVSPLGFDLSIYDIFGTLAAGGTVVVPPERHRRDPATWARIVETERVTIWNSVPVLLDMLVEAVAEQIESPLTPLRLCLLSGDWIPLRLPDAVRTYAPLARVVSLGGATEGSIWSILHEIEAVDPAWSSIPYGRAMTGQTVDVLGHDLEQCPAWVPGEIHIGGNGVADGYWRDAELTSRAFMRHPRTGARLYRTGDWGRRWPDGTIEFLGRHDSQVKVRGYRVELAEVELALQDVPGVERAIVVAPGERGNRRLIGFYTGAAATDRVRELLTTVLAGYMVPSVLRKLDALPLSSIGKVDRSALLALAEATDDEVHSAEVSVDAVSATLAEILGFHADDAPDPTTNLLATGLTSIDVIRIFNTIERRFGVRLDIERFFAEPTLATLADDLRRRLGTIAATGYPEKRPPQPSPWSRWPLLADPIERSAFRIARPSFGDPPLTRLLSPPPASDHDRRARRRSPSRFSFEPVLLDRLSAWLHCLRAETIDGRHRFLHPSAGGLYAVETYLHVRPGRVALLEAGLYRYHRAAHDLVTVANHVDLDLGLHTGVANRALAESAAFTVFFVADPADSAPLYGADAHTLQILDAGYIGQLLCDEAVRTGLAVCPIHGYHFDRVRWMFPAGDRVQLVHLLLGGVA